MLKKLFGGKDNKDNEENEFQFNAYQPTTNTCPYCSHKLEKIPSRKKKCPECEKYIFVRFGKLYTEDEKDIFDWLNHYNVQELDISRDDFNKTRQKLSKEFGFVASVNDTAWRLLNTINTPDTSYQYRKQIYMAMHHILMLEKKKTRHIEIKINKMELLDLKKAGIKHVKIYTCNDDHVCGQCNNLSGKVFDIEKVLKEMPIPNKCENEQCRCWYVPHFE